jgi:hypothetical protein
VAAATAQVVTATSFGDTPCAVVREEQLVVTLPMDSTPTSRA